jgi:hypothetical protein
MFNVIARTVKKIFGIYSQIFRKRILPNFAPVLEPSFGLFLYAAEDFVKICRNNNWNE